jgi:hypothetical protein
MTNAVSFELFERTNPQGRDLVLHWHQRARKAGKDQYHDPFDAFMRLWSGFNNWAMRVTDADTDAEMIQALAKSRPLNNAFAELLEDSGTFKTYATTFAKFWPIFNVKDLRKKGLRYEFQELDRPAYVRALLAAHVQHQPPRGFDRNNPSWDATIRAIYQARCNLIHGEKGDASDDYHIIEGAYRTLLTFIDGVGLYRWRNSDNAENWRIMAE